MKNNNDFFRKPPSELTTAKIEIFEKYIQEYLFKILMSYNRCLFADLFAGAGKNGDKDGSPIVLLNKIKYALTSERVQKQKSLYIKILFNDIDEGNINNLKNTIANIHDIPSCIDIQYKNQKFEDLFHRIIKVLGDQSHIAKFFFLDPFIYSVIKIEHLKQLMQLPHTEILLFLPIFHTYRFAKDKKMSDTHKTKIFLEEFTTNGVFDYEDLDDFLLAIEYKLKQDLAIPYIRSVILDAGCRKNALLLLTKHREGMLLMNQIASKDTTDGTRKMANKPDQISLFDVRYKSKKYLKYQKTLMNKLKLAQQISNHDIVELTICEGFLPKHAKEILKELYAEKKIKVFDNSLIEVSNSNKWAIAENPKKITYFNWIDSK